MKIRKGEEPLVRMRVEVMIRVIGVVIAAAMIMDLMMMTAALIVLTIAIEVMIACTVVMIRANPLVIQKMKMQTYSIRNMTTMWPIMTKT